MGGVVSRGITMTLAGGATESNSIIINSAAALNSHNSRSVKKISKYISIYLTGQQNKHAE